MESHSFRRASGESPETLRKLCLSKKIPHQEIRWNLGILCSAYPWKLSYTKQILAENLDTLSVDDKFHLHFSSFEKPSCLSPSNSKPEEEIESSYIDSEFGKFNRNTLDSLDSSRSGDESNQKYCMFPDRCKRRFGSFPFEPSQTELLTNNSPISKERKRHEKKRKGKYKSSPDLHESKL